LTEKAQAVARYLLQGIIPQFGIPVSIGLDNGPAFMAKVVQLVAMCLGITWKLHTAYHSQSLGKVECRNRILKLKKK
jgi:transposase InsO family protein